MLYVSLVASAVLLLTVNTAARRPSRGVRGPAYWGLGLALAMPLTCLGTFFPAVALQAALVCVAAEGWRAACWAPGRLLALTVGATLAAYGGVGYSALQTAQRYARVRDQHPFESLEGRVPLLKAKTTPVAYDEERLAALESGVEQAGDHRAWALQSIHGRSVEAFANAPGFGVGRVVRPRDWWLTDGLHDGPAPGQPTGDPNYWTPGAVPQAAALDPEPLDGLHADGVLDFVHPRGFGFVKDRSHVAGFQSHGFREVPKAAKVEVARLELVSLLLHDAPAVYVSDKLPRMDDLKGVPTRPLDPFEQDGLAALRKGDELYVRGSRMVGAVRAAKQCVDCHGGTRGELLGAFSYRLKPVER